MRLVTLNLRHGGGRRMPALLAALLGHAPDVVVLTQHRHNAASTLLRAAWFDPAVRETGATDHSALIVELQG
jgi:integrase